MDLNFHPDFSQMYEIQSVPVLLVMSKGEEQKGFMHFNRCLIC